MNTLYCIDYSNWVYKFNHTFSFARKTVNNVSVNIAPLWGYVHVLRTLPYKNIAICLDGRPKQFLELHPSYKGTRDKQPNNGIKVSKLDVIYSLTGLGELLDKNIFVLASRNQEADQVISSVVHYIADKSNRGRYKLISKFADTSDDPYLSFLPKDSYKEVDLDGYDSVIVGSTDSDLYQLARFPMVMVDTSMSGTKIANSTPVAVSGFPPAAIPIYKAIKGDTSDNIPGLSKKCKNLDSLNQVINQEDLIQFLHQFNVDKSTNPIVKFIKDTNQVKEFNHWLSITKLDFYSMPKLIKFSNPYSVKELLNSYGINV